MQWCLSPGPAPPHQRQAGWPHIPWAGLVLETSRQELVCGHWRWKGSGCLQSTKAFPTPPRVPGLAGQTEGGWRQALGPSDGDCGPSPHRHTPSCPGAASWGRRGSAGVNDQLEVETPKKLQSKSKTFQGENSEPLWVLYNPFQAWLLSCISSDAQSRTCQGTSLLGPGR